MTDGNGIIRQSMVQDAQDMVRSRNWSGALFVLDALLARWPDAADQHLELQRARVLRELGRNSESEVVVRRLLQRRPSSKAALKALLRALHKSGRHEEALQALDSSPLAHLKHAGLLATRLDCLIAMRRLADARVVFTSGMEWAADADSLTSLFEFLPRLFSGRERTEAWQGLLGKADRFVDGRNSREAAACLKLRLLLALRDYRRFSEALDRIVDSKPLGEYASTLLAVREALARPSFPDYSRPKIFGIGLSKTGTTSLSRALTILGFSTADWLNPLTRELVSDDDLALFDAFTDTPSCLNFERNFYMFPNSKFILTTRPIDKWAKSWAGHMKRLWSICSLSELREVMECPDSFIFGKPFSDIQMTLYGNYESLEDAYLSYDKRVRYFFKDKPRDRFLELDLYSGAGWPELCAFLGVSLPGLPFPWEKRAPGS